MNVRTLLLIISLVILLASGAAYVVFTVIGGPLNPRGDMETGARVSQPGPMYEVGPLMVNLSANGSPGVRFMRTGVVLEADSDKTFRELERREPQVIDRIISIVRQQTAQSIAGVDGQEQLRKQLLEAVNELLPEGRVVQVWFTDLVVQ